jgi:dTDP-4-dehydrorhamnose reductase
MRLIVTGSRGQLGRELVTAATAAGYQVLGLSRQEADPCDLTDRGATLDRIGAWQPDLVIHAAGATDVDACERHPGTAHALNVDATRHVAEAAARAGAHLVYVSTNHVFDGTADRPASEDDEPHPLSVYAATKLAGERIVGPDATVVRTAWLVSPTAPNLVTTVLRAAARPGPLRFVVDETAQPTVAGDLAPVLLRLGASRRAGCWHATNEGIVSAYELAREVLAAAGADPDRVHAITASELTGRVAARPRNGALDTRHLRIDGGGGLPDHVGSIAALVAHLTRSERGPSNG